MTFSFKPENKPKSLVSPDFETIFIEPFPNLLKVILYSSGVLFIIFLFFKVFTRIMSLLFDTMLLISVVGIFMQLSTGYFDDIVSGSPETFNSLKVWGKRTC